MMSTEGFRIQRAARWSGAEIGLRYVFQLSVMIGLARLVDPSAFGAIAMVTVFTALGTVFVDSGTGMALVQKQHTTIEEETSTFFLNLTISLVMCALLIACSPEIARFYGRPELQPFCIAMAFIFPLNGLAVVPDAILTQQLRFDLRTRVEVVSSIISGLAALIAAMAHLSAWALVWQALTSIGSRAALLYVVSGWRPRGRPSAVAIRAVTSFGGYMLLAGLIDTAYTRVQALLIGRRFSAGDVGQYSLAQNTQQAPTSFVAALLNRLGLPLLSSIRHDLSGARALLDAGMKLGLFAFMPAMGALAVLAEPTVAVVYGPRWSQAGAVLSVLALGSMPWPAHVLNLVAMNSQGRPRLVLHVEIAKKAIAVALLVLAAPYGLIAIAWSTVAASTVSFFLNAWFVGRLMQYGIVPQARAILWSLLPTGAAATLAWWCEGHLPSGLTSVIAAWLAAAGGALVVAALIKHPALTSVRRLMPSLRRTQHASNDHVES
ncbi:lipopolysaccharide biosynthesis protein [Luteibacter aegosomaticola]|uniref:lipopolysaccharide biosynthesis protein n=1 Tax=Luteibacter aegosomaticola TaxID=2911538 RepID=UPI001FFBBDDA|nr:lipopolysaccharide biosynthesis protein [Luteibacter aegosomaticola]UPG91441.1 lipopolysaccharide biosynthesis protein [Luteibacter aegosomaticola]